MNACQLGAEILFQTLPTSENHWFQNVRFDPAKWSHSQLTFCWIYNSRFILSYFVDPSHVQIYLCYWTKFIDICRMSSNSFPVLIPGSFFEMTVLVSSPFSVASQLPRCTPPVHCLWSHGSTWYTFLFSFGRWTFRCCPSCSRANYTLAFLVYGFRLGCSALQPAVLQSPPRFSNRLNLCWLRLCFWCCDWSFVAAPSKTYSPLSLFRSSVFLSRVSSACQKQHAVPSLIYFPRQWLASSRTKTQWCREPLRPILSSCRSMAWLASFLSYSWGTVPCQPGSPARCLSEFDLPSLACFDFQ